MIVTAGSIWLALQVAPLDRILVETDAPYLAPGKFRGKRNEPSYIVETADVLASVRGVGRNQIEQQTTDNFFHLFNVVR